MPRTDQARPGERPHLVQNSLDTHGTIRLTLGGGSVGTCTRSSAKATRLEMWKGERPADTTTNGSGATASVHSAGNDTSSPAESRT